MKKEKLLGIISQLQNENEELNKDILVLLGSDEKLKSVLWTKYTLLKQGYLKFSLDRCNHIFTSFGSCMYCGKVEE